MIYRENECVGCPPEMGCLGSACRYRNVLQLVCDHCHAEVDKLYWIGDEQWCAECVLDDCREVNPEADYDE